LTARTPEESIGEDVSVIAEALPAPALGEIDGRKVGVVDARAVDDKPMTATKSMPIGTAKEERRPCLVLMFIRLRR
jgi:hypothetical protein